MIRRRPALAASLLLALAGALLNVPGALAGGDVVLDGAAHYPEGLYWDAETGSLFYAEMTRHRIMRLAGAGAGAGVGAKAKPFLVERGCGPTAIGRAGKVLVIACHLGGYLLVTGGDGKPQQRIRVDRGGKRLRNPNDVAGDGLGVYISESGVFSPLAPATGAILYWRPGQALRRLVKGLGYANGLVVDHRRHRLLVSEHLARRILAYPIGADGGLGPASTFADLADLKGVASLSDLLADPLAGPDGLDLGPGGRLYAAVYGAGRIVVFDPKGQAVGSFPRPERYVTTVAVVPGAKFLFAAGAFNNRAYPYLGQVARVPLAAMLPARR